MKTERTTHFMKLTQLFAISSICWLPGCSSDATIPAPSSAVQIRPEVDAEIDALLGLVRDRLLLMHDVARWKLQEGLPIADAAREQAVIERSVQFAKENGLDADLAARFMQAQIEAGKQVQMRDLEAWKTSGPPNQKAPSDLSTELRPKIDQLGNALIISLSQLSPHLKDPNVQHVLKERTARLALPGELEEKDYATALAPLFAE